MSAIEPKHRLSPSGPRLPTEEDHKVLVDETDATPGFLASKVAAGPGIVLAVLPGVNEKVQISAPGSTIDEQVKITAADGAAGYLAAKLVAGTNVALTVLPPLANETLRVDVASAPPSGPAGGDLGGTYPNPSVDALTESFGPTSLPLGSIPAGSVLARIGGSIVGVAPVFTPAAHAPSHAPATGTDPLATAAPSQGIGGGNSAGVADSLARSDHDHTIRETGGPTNLTVGAVTDGQLLAREGTAIVGVNGANASKIVYMLDDFLCGAVASIPGWTSNVAGTAASVTVGSTGVDGSHQGVVQFTTGTTAAGRAGLRLANTQSNVAAAGSSMFYEVDVQLPNLSIAAQEFVYFAGYSDATAAGLFVTNAIAFVYDRVGALVGLPFASPNWLAVARGGVATTLNTGIAIVAGSWVRLRIEITPASGANFFINGVLVQTIALANLPGAAGFFAAASQIIKSVGPGPRTALVDYVALGYNFSPAR